MTMEKHGQINQTRQSGRRSAARWWTALSGVLIALAASAALTRNVPALPTESTTRPAAARAHVDQEGLPLNFEANQGQAPAEVEYLARGPAYAIALSGRGALLSFAGEGAKSSDTPDVIRLQLTGARRSVRPEAEQPLPGKVNYLIGSDPTRWRTAVPTYGKVRYADVYPGVDLVYYGKQGHLEYDFAVTPGANPNRIGVRFEGAQKLQLDAEGNLLVKTRGRKLAFERPVAYQLDGARLMPVEAGYRVAGNAVRFAVGNYDHSKALIIDPVLSYLSYLGGSNTESIGGVTGYGASGITNFTPAAVVDGSGNLYVVGSTYSTNFPTSGGLSAPPGKYIGQSKAWVFVSKVAPDATSLVYSTYIGGAFDDYGYAIAVDSAGSAYITGYTDSGDFPVTTGAFQTICAPTGNASSGESQNCVTPAGVNSGNQWGNAFVAKLNPAGNALAYSTFLGTHDTVGEAIAVDSSGRAYVAGNSPNLGCAGNPNWNCYPTTSGAVLTDSRSGFDQEYAFISVLNPSGSSLLYSTLYGDKHIIGTTGTTHLGFSTMGTAVAVDASGNFYLSGQTSDGQLPTTSGSLQPVPGPSSDANGDVNGIRAFIAKFSPAGGASAPTLLYGTYLGGATAGTADSVSGMAADAAGDAYIYGWTSDNAFPVTTGAYQTACGLGGAGTCANATYIAKLNPSGSKLIWATYFGDATGSGDGVGHTGAIAVDPAGNSYITGSAGSLLPQVNPIQAPVNGAPAFAAKIDPTGGKLLFSTLIGGLAGSQEGSGIAVDGSGNIYVAGNTNSAGVKTSAGVFQPAFGGTGGTGFNAFSGDGFVVKISALTVATATTLSATPSSAAVGTPVAFKAMVNPASGSAVPTGSVTFKNGTTVLGTATLNGTGQATFSTTSLAAGTYSVTAVYGGDSGDSTSTSSAVAVTINPAAPAPPTGLTATAGNAQVTLAWTASSGAASYNIYEGTSAGGESKTAVQTAVTGTSATITGLTNGTAYFFTVAAVNTGGTSGASPEVSATPTAPSTGGGGSGHGGGGALGGNLLMGLLGLAALRAYRTRRGTPKWAA